ncbi:MAG: hypothetical protein IKN56_03950, partial [Clostridia bacterium]|nr:hypothetical protein [Clostridia bacterium]
MKSDVLSLAAVYTRMIFRSWFQYRVDAILRSLAVFLRESTAIIVIVFTLMKFDSLNGWNIYEMLFLSLVLIHSQKGLHTQVFHYHNIIYHFLHIY